MAASVDVEMESISSVASGVSFEEVLRHTESDCSSSVSSVSLNAQLNLEAKVQRKRGQLTFEY